VEDTGEGEEDREDDGAGLVGGVVVEAAGVWRRLGRREVKVRDLPYPTMVMRIAIESCSGFKMLGIGLKSSEAEGLESEAEGLESRKLKDWDESHPLYMELKVTLWMPKHLAT
jgi:hypothetical protein